MPNHSAFRKRNPFDLNSRPFILLCHCGVESKTGIISRFMKTPIRPLKHSINLPPMGLAFCLIVLALACFALLPEVKGQISPPPNGCIPNFTTAAGCNALNLLSSGTGNTGLGWHALFSDSTGGFNTAVGGGALTLNNGDSNTAVGAAAFRSIRAAENTAVGTAALVNNDTGSNNSAFGTSALFSNTTGNENTTNGYEALFNNRRKIRPEVTTQLSVTAHSLTTLAT